MSDKTTTNKLDLLRFLNQRALGSPRVGSRATDSYIDDLKRNGSGPAGLGVLNLRPFPYRQLPPSVYHAVERAAREIVLAPSRGLPILREAIAAKLGDELSIPLDAESEVLITAGGMHALSVIFSTLLEKDDEVLVPSPCYFLEGIIEPLGARIVYVPMDERQNYRWDFDRLESAITERTKCLFMNTPVNPTGYVLSETDVVDVARIADKYNLLVIADESYNTMVYDGLRHWSIAALPAMMDRTLLVRSFTKSFAMPGWRVGYVVANADLIGPLTNTLEWNVLYGTYVAQVAAAAALAEPRDWLDGVAGEFQRNRDLLCAGIKSIHGLNCVRPSGGPFLFLNVSHLRGDSQEIARALLIQYGIPTTPGSYFHSPEHVRIAFGGEPDVLHIALRRLESAAKHLGKLD